VRGAGVSSISKMADIIVLMAIHINKNLAHFRNTILILVLVSKIVLFLKAKPCNIGIIVRVRVINTVHACGTL
jgi:hypothetical protein